uniref:Uncharacterized protein n=1 Tax=Arundo donax TaxID=35708 RepID=A0A0A9E0I0_ARUDO
MAFCCGRSDPAHCFSYWFLLLDLTLFQSERIKYGIHTISIVNDITSLKLPFTYHECRNFRNCWKIQSLKVQCVVQCCW